MPRIRIAETMGDHHRRSARLCLVELEVDQLAIAVNPSVGQPREGAPGKPTHFPVNYAINYGTWLVFDAKTSTTGNGAFVVNAKIRDRAFRDQRGPVPVPSKARRMHHDYQNHQPERQDL